MSTKRGNDTEKHETQLEGLDLTSEDNEEPVRGKVNNKNSPISSTTGNLIPGLNSFTLSPSLTQSSPLLHDSLRQNNSIFSDIRQSPLTNDITQNNIRYNPLLFTSRHQHRLHFHNNRQLLNNNLHRRSNSVTHPSIRCMRPVRHPALQFSAQERQELIEANLRRSEVLRRKMQVIEYELFIISKNIEKLQE